MKTQKTGFAIAAISIFATVNFFSQENNGSTEEKILQKDTIKVNGKSVNTLLYATEQTLDLLLKEKRAVIVHYGLVPIYNTEFEKKYGVKIHNEGCVITYGESNPAKINNILISKYLTKDFGENWKKDLGFTPFGVD